MFVGYDIKDVRQFLVFAKTGYFHGTGKVYKEVYAVGKSGAEKEHHLWQPKHPSKTLAFCIRAIDDAGNVSKVSNVASALRPVKTKAQKLVTNFERRV